MLVFFLLSSQKNVHLKLFHSYIGERFFVE